MAVESAVQRVMRVHQYPSWPTLGAIHAALGDAEKYRPKVERGGYAKELEARQRKHWNEAVAQAMRPYEQRYAGDRSMLFEVRSLIRQNIGGVVHARMAGDQEPALPRLTDAELEECRWRADRFAESPETADEVEDAA